MSIDTCKLSGKRFGTLLRGLAVAAAMIAAPALAQQNAAPDKAGRAWIDPPVHGAAAPADGSAGTVPDKVEQAETAKATRPAAAPSARQAGAASRPARAKAAARPSEERRRSARVAASARPAAPPHHRGIRVVTLRPDPAEAYAPPPRYRPVMIVRPEPGFSGPFEDDRARRIRLARESGYVLIRARTYRLPDGRRWQTFNPADDFDE